MKKIIATFIAGVTLATVGIANATTNSTSMITNGVWCKPMSGGVGCVLTTGEGYGVAIHRDFVFVMNDNGKRVFTRYQP